MRLKAASILATKKCILVPRNPNRLCLGSWRFICPTGLGFGWVHLVKFCIGLPSPGLPASRLHVSHVRRLRLYLCSLRVSRSREVPSQSPLFSLSFSVSGSVCATAFVIFGMMVTTSVCCVLCAHPLSFPPHQLRPVHYLRLLTSPQKMLISGDLKTYIATEQSRLTN